MSKGNDLKEEHINILKNIKNPTITEIIRLSKELNIDIKMLAKYFIDKTEKEIEFEK